jgi:Ca2+-binding RTX toxin-like protein
VTETVTSVGGTTTQRLVENTGNDNVVTVTLPNGVSLVNSGARTATERTRAINDLLKSIQTAEPTNLTDQSSTAVQWLSSRPAETQLDIRTLTLSSNTLLDAPIRLGGDTDGSAENFQEAFVIDVTKLATGNQIQLDNIDFASIIGGAGNNVVIGDDAAQTIVLGPGDDELHGGGGNDVIGSEGGNDRLFGSSGDDTLFGGAGADLLHGGSDHDVARYAGNHSDYVITQQFGVVTVQSKSDESDIDTLVNIETLSFSDGDLALSFDTNLIWLTGLYEQVLGRQADVGGIQHWAQQHANGADRADIALAMLNSEESGLVVQQGDTFLDQLYTGLLGRDADIEGKQYWATEMAAGVSAQEVTNRFLLSEEMRSHDLNTEAWDFLV